MFSSHEFACKIDNSEKNFITRDIFKFMYLIKKYSINTSDRLAIIEENLITSNRVRIYRTLSRRRKHSSVDIE